MFFKHSVPNKSNHYVTMLEAFLLSRCVEQLKYRSGCWVTLLLSLIACGLSADCWSLARDVNEKRRRLLYPVSVSLRQLIAGWTGEASKTTRLAHSLNLALGTLVMTCGSRRSRVRLPGFTSAE